MIAVYQVAVRAASLCRPFQEAVRALPRKRSGWQRLLFAQPPSLPTPHARRTSGRSLRESNVACLGRASVFSSGVQSSSSSMDLTALERELGCELSSEAQHGERPVVAVISGPSGVGKDAAIRALQAQRPDIHFVVTATSRAMRPGEVDGVDYIFVSKEQFEQWIANDEMLEHALVYGQYKGIPRAQVQGVLEQGRDVVLRLDVQGAATVRRLIPDCISIFIAAESERALAERLVARSTELPDELKTRVETARAEASQVKDFDYVVVNRSGKLEETVRRLAAIIDAEKSRVSKTDDV